jgi:nucleotide-sensitive chloride channel 1A
MAMELTSEVPTVESFIPLSEHQSQTPGTFFGGRPVLHYHSLGAKLLISQSQYAQFAALHELRDTEGQNGSIGPNGTSAEDVTITGVDAWVTSQ